MTEQEKFFVQDEEMWLIDLMYLEKKHVDEKVRSCVLIWP